MFLHDHLPLTQITNHNGSLNQFVRDEMRRFVQRVTLLVALLLCHPLVDLGEVNVSPRLLLAFGTLRSDFVKLFVVGTSAFKATHMIEATLLVHSSCQCLDAQVEC